MADHEDLSFKQLTLKMVMLMALASADRASDHHLLDIRHVQSQPDDDKFTVAGLLKSRRSGSP